MNRHHRLFFLLCAAFLACCLIGLLSALLQAGSPTAVFLLDKQSAHMTFFPYPVTFQNVMTLCFFVALGELFFRFSEIQRQKQFFEMKLLPEDPHAVLTSEDLPALRERLSRKTGSLRGFLPHLIDQCSLNFQANRSISSAHQVFSSMNDLELHRMDLRYNLLRYLVWLLPTLGFIGTVVGIALALSDFSTSVGDGKSIQQILPGISANLGLAFYTTIIALFYSAVLVWLMQWLQATEEDLVNKTSSYCLENFLNRLYIHQS